MLNYEFKVLGHLFLFNSIIFKLLRHNVTKFKYLLHHDVKYVEHRRLRTIQPLVENRECKRGVAKRIQKKILF